MSISAFFLNRRFSDRRFLQVFLRGLGGRLFILGFVLVLSVLFLGLGGGQSASAQTKKHYLGEGLAVMPVSADLTGMRNGPPFEPKSSDGTALGIQISYIYALHQRFWLARAYL